MSRAADTRFNSGCRATLKVKRGIDEGGAD